MRRYRFELATPADDADLRHILAATPMEGSMVVSFRREPSYFNAAVVEGAFRQVVAARDMHSQRFVGFGSRAISSRYVNGAPAPVGYLSSLRLLAPHRNVGLVARGYRYFRELHSDGRTSFYLTTIAAENRAALDLLTSGRAGLPHYEPIGDYHTFALACTARRSSPPVGLAIRRADPSDLQAVCDFLHREGSKQQFFPCYEKQDFWGTDGLLRGLPVHNILIAWKQDRIRGLIGVWDQRQFRQTVIDGYLGGLRLARPFYNVWATMKRSPRLPPAGTQLQSTYAAFPLVADGDTEVFSALVTAARSETTRVGANYLLLGLHDSDLMLPVMRSLRSRCYTTHTFLVTWDDVRELKESLNSRHCYLELGAL